MKVETDQIEKNTVIKEMAQHCERDTKALFYILKGNVPTCNYLELVTHGRGKVWEFDVNYMRAEYGKHILLAS